MTFDSIGNRNRKPFIEVQNTEAFKKKIFASAASTLTTLSGDQQLRASSQKVWEAMRAASAFIDCVTLCKEIYELGASLEKQGQNEECSICFEPLQLFSEKEISKLGCDHKFHKECIEDWMKTVVSKNTNVTCPLCRIEFDASQII